MNEQALNYITAARVPERLKPQTFGPWIIQRVYPASLGRFSDKIWKVIDPGFVSVTFLKHITLATLHLDGETVMEDSLPELRKHLPIWMSAEGRVLVTGLGLGCVVRGLLTKPEVDEIDVVEIDKHILRVVGHEFASNRRVHLHHGDAFHWEPGSRRYEWAWHDLWAEGPPHISLLHTRLMIRYREVVKRQGAWGMPRYIRRRLYRGKDFFDWRF